MLKEGDKIYLLQKNIAIKRLSNKLDYKKLGLFNIIETKGPLGSLLALKTEV